jgi:hypothetical protein
LWQLFVKPNCNFNLNDEIKNKGVPKVVRFNLKGTPQGFIMQEMLSC